MSVRGAHRVAVDSPCFDPLAAPALDRVVDAEQHRTAWDKGGEQEAQQQARAAALAPSRPAEDPMIIDKPRFTAEPRDPQQAGHGALAGREDRADQQCFGVPPAPVAEERGKR
jgi:hypothetical protein